MITVGRLKELLNQIPDNEKLYAYEGEVTGIVIGDQKWFISAICDDEEDTYVEGFK